MNAPTPPLCQANACPADAYFNGWADTFAGWPRRQRMVLIVGASTLAGGLLLAATSAPLELYSQSLFALLCFTLALGLRALPGRLPELALIVLSLVVSLRYMYWRLTSTLGFDTWLSAVFGYGLVAAEFYALVVLLFGYVQTA